MLFMLYSCKKVQFAVEETSLSKSLGKIKDNFVGNANKQNRTSLIWLINIKINLYCLVIETFCNSNVLLSLQELRLRILKAIKCIPKLS